MAAIIESKTRSAGPGISHTHTHPSPLQAPPPLVSPCLSLSRACVLTCVASRFEFKWQYDLNSLCGRGAWQLLVSVFVCAHSSSPLPTLPVICIGPAARRAWLVLDLLVDWFGCCFSFFPSFPFLSVPFPRFAFYVRNFVSFSFFGISWLFMLSLPPLVWPLFNDTRHTLGQPASLCLSWVSFSSLTSLALFGHFLIHFRFYFHFHFIAYFDGRTSAAGQQHPPPPPSLPRFIYSLPLFSAAAAAAHVASNLCVSHSSKLCNWIQAQCLATHVWVSVRVHGEGGGGRAGAGNNESH